MSKFKTVQEVLDKNHAIFNYLYDRFGFRYGIVVACKGIDKWHPRIGWAFFEEVKHREVTHNKMSEIPMYETLFKYNPDKESVEFVNDVYVPDVYETVVCDKNAKIELFELACERANYNSFDYFVCNKPDVSQYGTDLRSTPEYIHTRYMCNDGSVDSFTNRYYDDDAYQIPRTLRKTIRETEFRAYKYFKK